MSAACRSSLVKHTLAALPAAYIVLITDTLSNMPAKDVQIDKQQKMNHRYMQQVTSLTVMAANPKRTAPMCLLVQQARQVSVCAGLGPCTSPQQSLLTHRLGSSPPSCCQHWAAPGLHSSTPSHDRAGGPLRLLLLAVRAVSLQGCPRPLGCPRPAAAHSPSSHPTSTSPALGHRPAINLHPLRQPARVAHARVRLPGRQLQARAGVCCCGCAGLLWPDSDQAAAAVDRGDARLHRGGGTACTGTQHKRWQQQQGLQGRAWSTTSTMGLPLRSSCNRVATGMHAAAALLTAAHDRN